MKAIVRSGFATLRPILIPGLVVIWELIFLSAVGYADDCGRYLQNPATLAIDPRNLVEDCMRTGYGQAVATGLVGGIGGAAIANAVTRALSGAPPPTQPPPT